MRRSCSRPPQQMRPRPDGRTLAHRRSLWERRCKRVEALETYTSVLTVLSVALLLVTGGLGKKQLVWKTRIPAPVRRRRRRP